MLYLRFIILLSFFTSITLVNIQAQIKADDLVLKVNKSAKKLEVYKKSDGSNITSQLRVNRISIDIFDKEGEYAGSIELKDWARPLDEFSPDEIIKITIISLTATQSSQTIELKDIRLNL